MLGLFSAPPCSNKNQTPLPRAHPNFGSSACASWILRTLLRFAFHEHGARTRTARRQGQWQRDGLCWVGRSEGNDALDAGFDDEPQGPACWGAAGRKVLKLYPSILFLNSFSLLVFLCLLHPCLLEGISVTGLWSMAAWRCEPLPAPRPRPDDRLKSCAILSRFVRNLCEFLCCCVQ